MNSVLAVVAHPDDEVLGCGATMAALAAANVPVRACILSGRAAARQHRPDDPDLLSDLLHAQQVLGIGEPIVGDFPNISFNTVPHLELVQFIEQAIAETGANVIFTQHPADLNNDHVHVSQACQAAARLFQRRPNFPPLRALYFMETLSATDWAFRSGGNDFQADTFYEIGEEFLTLKIQALQAYRGVMRDFPHPRSPEILRGLSAFRGGQAGMRYAEAFQTAYRTIAAGDFKD
jgi:LmbE family N-acetylglucosaminyl deacetylase